MIYVPFLVKQHAAKGGEIIRETFGDTEHNQYAQMAYQMAECHHEKWNGKGYPHGPWRKVLILLSKEEERTLSHCW